MFDLQFAGKTKTFQANPSDRKKALFLGVGLAGVAAVAFAALTKNKTGDEPFFFAGGLTAVIFCLRFYFMQVMNGAARLTFSSDGISVGKKKSSQTVAWDDLQSIRYRAGRSGHYWEIKSHKGESLEFYLDGITSRQQEELRAMVKSLDLPDVRIELYHDPLAKAA